MQTSTPQLISPEQFNQQVKGWTVKTRRRFAANAPVGTGKSSSKRESKKLAASIESSTKKYGEVIGKIRFGFEKHGVYVHYGVGRGYIRQGNAVVRGSRNQQPVRSPGFNRRPKDWFDVEIKRGIRELADITQQYYGDAAMEKILKDMDKTLIQKK